VTLFVGHFEYSLDDRGRIPVPPRYRKELEERAVLSLGSPDRCLRLYNEENFFEQAKLYMKVPVTKRAGRATRRSLLTRAAHVDADKQGRILIPAPMREYAGLSATVYVVGIGECLEIWDPRRYETEMEAVDEELEETLEAMEE
jgi:MraZ protein